MNSLMWLGSSLGLLAIAAVGLTAYGERRWADEVDALQAGLEAGRLDGMPGDALRPTRYEARELEGLPAPVERYFRTVLKDGQPIINAVTIDVAGRFNMSATGAQWRPFTSRQRVVTRRPGFLWNAKIAMLPGVNVRVVDSYIAGNGLLRAAVQGLVTMADMRGDGDIARGEFMRWFAEMLWYPTALLPSQGVRWEAVDDHSANATVEDGPLGLTLLFRFNDAGLIDSFRAESRAAWWATRWSWRPGRASGRTTRRATACCSHSLARWPGCGPTGASRTSSAR